MTLDNVPDVIVVTQGSKEVNAFSNYIIKEPIKYFDKRSEIIILGRPKAIFQFGAMDNSSAQGGEGKSSSTASVVDSKKPNVDPQDNPEEINGASAGYRLTQEMLDYYYQKSKELARYKREYEEAAYRVYGTIPSGVDPQKFRERMAEIPKKRSSTV